MSRRERRFAEESVEDHQSDDLAAEHLGGIDPQRLLGLDDRDSPRDPAP
jgi:hypothetical protein